MPDTATSATPVEGQVTPAPDEGKSPTEPMTWDTFKQTIPAELRDEKMFASFKDPAAYHRTFVEAQRALGGSIRLPGKDTKPEDLEKFYGKLDGVPNVLRMPGSNDQQEVWDKFFGKLGRPETADGYQISLPPLPEGLDYDPNLIGAFKKASHAAGLAPGQVQAIMNAYGEVARGTFVNFNKESQKAVAKLEEEYGPGYQGELSYAAAAIKQLGGDDLWKKMATNPLGNDLTFLKMMVRVGKLLSEDNVVDVQEIRESKTGWQNELDTMMNDPKSAYHNRRDPGHKKAVERVTHLFAMLNPGKAEAS